MPAFYFVAVGLCAVSLIVALANARRPWALPFGTVVATVSAWYLVEPFYFPDLFAEFTVNTIEMAYVSVSIFFIALLFTAPFVSMKFQPRIVKANFGVQYISADRLVFAVMGVWLALLAFGTYRMGGDLLGALFPIDGRAGARMWSRAAGAGAGGSGFIVSFASYVYVLCLASFGVLFFFVRSKRALVLLVLLVLVSWPYAFLQGSRNIVLATVAPAGLAFLLFSRISPLHKFIVTVAGLVVLDFAMRVIISFRSTGFSEIAFSTVGDTAHLGLNMASELVYITAFLDRGTLSLTYGLRYLEELANVVPRAVWPNKPLVGIDYAIARGFADPRSDIGVFATISSGLIGQGVLNFGNIFGPVAAAALMSLWIGFLARLRMQGTPLRLALFLVGLGLTFNLGRDITLLVLWPVVFGYIGVRILEYREKQRHQGLVPAVNRRHMRSRFR